MKQVVDLRGQLDLKVNENQKLEEMKDALAASNEELNKTLEDLNQKLKEVIISFSITLSKLIINRLDKSNEMHFSSSSSQERTYKI